MIVWVVDRVSMGDRVWVMGGMVDLAIAGIGSSFGGDLAAGGADIWEARSIRIIRSNIW